MEAGFVLRKQLIMFGFYADRRLAVCFEALRNYPAQMGLRPSVALWRKQSRELLSFAGTSGLVQGNGCQVRLRGVLHMPNRRFPRIVLFALLAASLLVMIPAPAAAQRVAMGFYGGPFWGPWGWGYPAYAYGPYGYPYGGRPLGEVHIKSPNGDAQIYINGALAGRAHDLKRFYLVPGTYNLEQRIGSDVQKQKVYVIANRTLKIEFEKPGVANNTPPVAPVASPAPAPTPAPPPATAPTK
jgi:hypothetical protein